MLSTVRGVLAAQAAPGGAATCYDVMRALGLRYHVVGGVAHVLCVLLIAAIFAHLHVIARRHLRCDCRNI